MIEKLIEISGGNPGALSICKKFQTLPFPMDLAVVEAVFQLTNLRGPCLWIMYKDIFECAQYGHAPEVELENFHSLVVGLVNIAAQPSKAKAFNELMLSAQTLPREELRSSVTAIILKG